MGLVNQAMTCYLNSLLQTLYMTPEFRNALYKWRFMSADDGAKCIPYQLQKLFIHLQVNSYYSLIVVRYAYLFQGFSQKFDMAR